MYLIDTHCHLDLPAGRQVFNDIPGVLARAKEAGVGKILCVGTSVDASRKCAEIARKYSTRDLQIFATIGIHAEEGKKDIEKYGSLDACIKELKKILLRLTPDQDDKKIVGVGECGFDFHLPAGKAGLPVEARPVTSDQEKEFQKELFAPQIKLALDLKLPLIIHCRNAWDETFDLLSGYSSSFPRKRESGSGFRIKSGMTGGGLRGVFHSWTGDWQAAQKAIELGFYISFSGIVTFLNAATIKEVAQKIPLDKMLLETDSPYLSPEPLRGRTNEPKNVTITLLFLASLRNLAFENLAEVTSRNAENLFTLT